MMPFRRDQLEAYGRFSIKQGSSIPVPLSCPNTPLGRVEEGLTRPAPPTSKPIREPSVSGSAHLTTLVSIESLEMLKDYQTTVKQLAGTCENLIQERDFWRVKAESARSNKDPQDQAAREDKRIEALRRLLARELHPDMAKPSTEEAALRAKLFKQLWPEIDRIAKGQSGK
jgi:hypothetical protein